MGKWRESLNGASSKAMPASRAVEVLTAEERAELIADRMNKRVHLRPADRAERRRADAQLALRALRDAMPQARPPPPPVRAVTLVSFAYCARAAEPPAFATHDVRHLRHPAAAPGGRWRELKAWSELSGEDLDVQAIIAADPHFDALARRVELDITRLRPADLDE